MERIPIPNMAPELAGVLTRIMDESLGVFISLDSAPTTTGGELQTNQAAFYNGNLYINFNGTVYRFTGTQV